MRRAVLALGMALVVLVGCSPKEALDGAWIAREVPGQTEPRAKTTLTFRGDAFTLVVGGDSPGDDARITVSGTYTSRGDHVVLTPASATVATDDESQENDKNLVELMMGGKDDAANALGLKSADEFRLDEIKAILDVRDRVAKERGLKDWQVAVKDLADDARVRRLVPDEQSRQQAVSTALFSDLDQYPKPRPLGDFQPLDVAGSGGVLEFAIAGPDAGQDGATEMITIKEALGGNDVFVFQLRISPKTAKGQEALQKPETRWYGPVTAALKDRLVRQASGVRVEELARRPVALFANAQGSLIAVAGPELKEPHRVLPMMPLSYYPITPDEYRAAQRANEADPSKPMPRPREIRLAVATNSDVSSLGLLRAIGRALKGTLRREGGKALTWTVGENVTRFQLAK